MAWVDESGAIHTVWMAPELLLGETVFDRLRLLPHEERARALQCLDADFDQVVARVTPLLPDGPTDVLVGNDAMGDEPFYPTVALPEASALLQGSLTEAIRPWVENLPAQWQIEAIEALSDALED